LNIKCQYKLIAGSLCLLIGGAITTVGVIIYLVGEEGIFSENANLFSLGGLFIGMATLIGGIFLLIKGDRGEVL
jgi:hypothetical protein